MKRSYKYGSLLFVVCSLLMVSCTNPTAEQTEMPKEEGQIYYCPMHPDVQQDHPGKCPRPECNGMELVLKDNEEYLATALKPVSSNVLSKINIIKPVFKKVAIKVDADGFIDYDNFSKYDISSPYSGRIDKLYIRYNYQSVNTGDVVFELYNADLVTAQENYIYLLKTSKEEKQLINSAKQKLKLLEFTDEQIAEIGTTKKAMLDIPIYSKYDGHVHEMQNGEMNKEEMSDYSKSPLLSIKEGMYVEKGEKLFNVINHDNIIVMLKIKGNDIGKIKMGEKVDFFINSDTALQKGEIDFIEPVFDSRAKTLMVRVNMNNPEHKKKIGSLVTAKISCDSLETLWIPASAVVDLGKSKIVWVWKDGSLKAKKVETGISENGMIEIADGLTEASQIAGEAHYLTDSEGFVKVNDEK